MHMMKMFFHFGFGDQFLFEPLYIDSTFKMWATCGVMFILCLIFEFIKYVRVVRCSCSQLSEVNDNDNNIRIARNCYINSKRSRKNRLIQALLHVLQTAIGFVIMLAVMSFNLCIIFAILVGK